MGGLVARLWEMTTAPAAPRSDIAMPDFTGSFYDLVDAAQTTHGMIVIAAVLACAWVAFRAFR